MKPATSPTTADSPPAGAATLAVGDRRLSVDLSATTTHLAARPAAAVEARRSAHAAVETPHGYPALSAALAPGDHVAIAVGEGVPQVAEVVAGVVDALAAAAVDVEQVLIVTSRAADRHGVEELLRQRPPQHAAPWEVRCVLHDPDDPQQLCFVGLTRKGHPLELNRQLSEADVVVPIACARPDAARGSCGAYDGLFPWFSSTAAIARFRHEEITASVKRHSQHTAEAEEAGWLLGAPLVVQVTPGPDGAVAGVFAGAPAAARAAAEEQHAALWRSAATRSADLVIATLGGEASEQTWENVGRALAVARRVARDESAVAICTAVAERVGKSLGRLVGAFDLADVARRIAADASRDSWVAHELVRALERGPVYLMSGLADDVVEELGLAPIHSAQELSRLISRSHRCVILSDAQYIDIVEG